MKFRYYITNLLQGEVQGTDDRQAALSYSLSEDFFVVDSEDGMWIVYGVPTEVNCVPTETAQPKEGNQP